MSTTLNSTFSLWRWLSSVGYIQGVIWTLCACIISNLNDILMRKTGSRLDSIQVVFFRFFFATLILLPFMLWRGKRAFLTSRFNLHTLRVILGFGAVTCWCYGVTQVPLTTVTIFSLTVPLFILPMAYFLLKEQVGWQHIIATMVGFSGILVIVRPVAEDFNIGGLVLLAGSVLFALSDILNKKMVNNESSYTMLFYFAVGTSIAGTIPTFYVWQTPTFYELSLLGLLGLGGNLILFCFLKALSATDVSALAPFRYVELLVSGVFGFLLFNEIPGIWELLGAAIIVPSTLAITYYETHKRKKPKVHIIQDLK